MPANFMFAGEVAMCNFIKFICTVIIFTVLKTSAVKLSCDPGEEFHSHNLTSDGVYNGYSYWAKDNKSNIMVNCDSSGTMCLVQPPLIQSYSISYINNELVLTVKNATQETAGTFYYFYPDNQETSCKFNVYAPPKELLCEVTDNRNNCLSIKCKNIKSFPEALCQFSWTQNGAIKSQTENIIYETSNHSIGKYMYYFTNCSMFLPAESLGLGFYHFEATAYPNVTGQSIDNLYGKKSILLPPVNISYPTVNLEQCLDEYYLEDTNVTCICTETSNKFVHATVRFYNSTSLLTENQDGLASYSFLASRVFAGIFCEASLFNYTSLRRNFTSSIAYGPKTVSPEVKHNGEITTTLEMCNKTNPVTVQINCRVAENTVNPGVIFELYVNGTRQNKSNLNYIVKLGGLLNLTCVAINSKFPQVNAIKQLFMNITEPPLEPVIYAGSMTSQDIESKKLTTPEGSITIWCKADGGIPQVSNIYIQCGSKPPITYEGNMASVNVNISRYTNSCSCTASHISVCYRNSTVLGLNVTFPSTVLSMKANNNEQSITVNKLSFINITCVAEGNPLSTVTLTKNSAMLRALNTTNHKFNITLEVNNTAAECIDTGVYVCQAGESTKNVTIFVNCIPYLANSTSKPGVYYVHLNETINIVIPVIAYPQPNISLLKNSTQLTKAQFNLSYINLDPPYGKILLHISSESHDIFQNYLLNITNDVGTFMYSFQIRDADELTNAKTGKKNIDITAITAGVVAGAVVLVIIVVIIILLRRKGILGKENKNASTEMLSQDIVEIDNHSIYNSKRTLDENSSHFDNSDIYNMNKNSDEVEFDNADIYNMQSNSSDNPRQNSKYKKYTEVVTTVTTASAAPKNMKTNEELANLSIAGCSTERMDVSCAPLCVLVESSYEDVNQTGKKMEAKAKPPKPVPKPKLANQRAKIDGTEIGPTDRTDQTYASVAIDKKSAKPVTVHENEGKETYYNTTEPEIPDRKYEEKENNMNANIQKATVYPTPDYHNVIQGTNENHESTTYGNSGFSHIENDTDLYANVTGQK